MSTNQKIGAGIAALVALTGVVALVVNACQTEESTEVTKTLGACSKAETDAGRADKIRLAYFDVLEKRRARGASVPDEKQRAWAEIDAAYREGNSRLAGDDCEGASNKFGEAIRKAHAACPLSFDPECRHVSDIEPG